MTRAERDALRALEAKATPGKFKSFNDGGAPAVYAIRNGGISEVHVQEDCDLLAAARNNIVALLDALDDADKVISAAYGVREFSDPNETACKEFDVLADAYDAKHGAE